MAAAQPTSPGNKLEHAIDNNKQNANQGQETFAVREEIGEPIQDFIDAALHMRTNDRDPQADFIIRFSFTIRRVHHASPFRYGLKRPNNLPGIRPCIFTPPLPCSILSTWPCSWNRAIKPPSS